MGIVKVETLHANMNRQGRNQMTWPTLLRTSDKLVMQRPTRGDQRWFSVWMDKHLPEYKFNAKRGWWEVALDTCNYDRATSQCRVKIHRHKWRETLHISDGVREWVEEEALK